MTLKRYQSEFEQILAYSYEVILQDTEYYNQWETEASSATSRKTTFFG